MQLHQNTHKSTRHFSNQVPLRLVLIIPFVLQIFAAVSLTGYLSISNGRKAVNDLASQLQSEISSRVDQHLANYLSTPKKINQATVDAIESRLLKSDDLPSIGRFFWGQMQLFDVSYINYGLVKGGYAGAGITIEVEGKPISISETSAATGNINKNFATDAKGNRTNLRLSIEDYDYRKEAWYINATNQKSGWSQIYAWDVDNAVAVSISNSQPIYDRNNNLIGAVGVDLLLLGISDFLRQLKLSPNSRVFIIERDGTIVAKSNKEKFYKKLKNEVKRLKAVESSDSLIQATAKYLHSFNGFNKLKQTKQFDFDLKGQRQFIQVTPWKDEEGLDWLVVIAVPESDFMGQINSNTRTTIMLCIVALVMATLLGIYTSRWIARPILKLNAASQTIASGQLDYQVEINRIRELGSLAQSFNKMAQQLRESFTALEKTNAELENRVEERTAELKQAKISADIANHAKSEFLASMSHELRTPLNGILGYAQILLRDKTASPKQKDGIDIIYQCGSHLLTLINDILDLSKIEAGKLELYPKDFHFASFITSVNEICRIRAEQKEIDFIYEARNKLPVALHGDEKRLRQVLLNLLGNAIKFTDKGCVTLKVGVVNDLPDNTINNINQAPMQETSNCSKPIYRIRYQIEDTGIGMTPQQLEKIFLPFEQVGEKQRMSEGTGLGLTISQRIVEMMGSQLQVESIANLGSTFWFEVELPLATEWVESKPNSVTYPIGYKYNIENIHSVKMRILVIDDRWENCSVIANLLEPLGFEVAQAENGQEGLDKAITLLPDLIITDIAMPVLNGLDMTKQLRVHPTTKTIPIIVSSASVFNFDRQQSRDAGADDFLPKPVSSIELLEQLQKYLNIDWVYDVGAPTSSLPLYHENEETLIIPPVEELQTLYAAAKIGDIAGVESEALQISQINPQYQLFTEAILKLVHAMDDEAIFKFIKSYIN